MAVVRGARHIGLFACLFVRHVGTLAPSAQDLEKEADARLATPPLPPLLLLPDPDGHSELVLAVLQQEEEDEQALCSRRSMNVTRHALKDKRSALPLTPQAS